MPDLRDQLRTELGGTYAIDRELHGGGMSRVFLAEETQFERRVVIKVLSPELSAGISAERFEREIKLAAQLQQANIVAVHAAGEVGGLPYYTMPFVEGESLRTRLSHGQQLSLSECVATLRDVARALAYAHGKGVVHRDIKPENVLLSGDAAVVTDFGIAKAVSESRTNTPGGTLTVVGTSLGTPAYMAPEQAVGDTVDHRADIYAWGLVAYEVLTGAHPFAGKSSAQQWITAQLTEKPVPIQQLRSGLPKGLAAIVMKAIEKEPANRPQSAREILPSLDDPNLAKLSGDFARRSSAGSKAARPKRSILVAAVVAVLLIAGFLARHRIPGSPRPATAVSSGDATGLSDSAINTVAVMPFSNTSGNTQDEYFSDGMTDELAHALSRLPAIRVASRTSSYAFKGKSVSPQEIGKTLNVRGIVEGTVRRAGDRLRVTAQLSSASDGLVVWSDNYESKAKDVFALQDEFTKAIVTAIAPALQGKAAASIASDSRGTANPEAYDLYLKGHYFWARRGSSSLLRAIELFNEALTKDPKFARAYAGLGLAQVILPQYLTSAGDTMVGKAIANATRAVSLDSTLAEGHMVLGFAAASRMQFDKSAKQYRKAIQLDPSNAVAHMWSGLTLLAAGRINESLAEMREAARLDPLSPAIGGNYAGALIIARQFEAATAQAHKVLEIDSVNFVSTHGDLAFANVFLGRTAEAVHEVETFYRLAPESPAIRGSLVFVYAAAGQWNKAKKVRDDIARRNSGRAGDPDLLMAAIAFGDRARALTLLEQSFADRSFRNLSRSPGCDPSLGLLAQEPRFISLMHSSGITPCPVRERWPISAPPP